MKTTTALFTLLIAACMSISFVGCDKHEPAPNSGSLAPGQSAASLPLGLFVTAPPANAKSVEEVKSKTKSGDAVVIRGRVGGSKTPFVDGRAVLTIMGSGLKACSDSKDDECTTPWDYCCETADDIAKHSATIQVVDASGAPIKASIQGQNGIKELSELVVAGKVIQANDKVLIIAASAIFNAKP